MENKMHKKIIDAALALGAVSNGSYNTVRHGNVASFSGVGLVWVDGECFVAFGHGPDGDAQSVWASGWVEIVPVNREQISQGDVIKRYLLFTGETPLKEKLALLGQAVISGIPGAVEALEAQKSGCSDHNATKALADAAQRRIPWYHSNGQQALRDLGIPVNKVEEINLGGNRRQMRLYTGYMCGCSQTFSGHEYASVEK